MSERVMRGIMLHAEVSLIVFSIFVNLVLFGHLVDREKESPPTVPSSAPFRFPTFSCLSNSPWEWGI